VDRGASGPAIFVASEIGSATSPFPILKTIAPVNFPSTVPPARIALPAAAIRSALSAVSGRTISVSRRAWMRVACLSPPQIRRSPLASVYLTLRIGIAKPNGL
jgi:hypothetical protein